VGFIDVTGYAQIDLGERAMTRMRRTIQKKIKDEWAHLGLHDCIDANCKLDGGVMVADEWVRDEQDRLCPKGDVKVFCQEHYIEFIRKGRSCDGS